MIKLDKIYVKGDLVKMNEHDNTNRNNRFAGAALKKRMTAQVVKAVEDVSFRIEEPVYLGFIWYFSGKHDFDNTRFSAKYVLDGLQKAKILPNDNQNWVKGFTGDKFVKVEPGSEGVDVLLTYESDLIEKE